MINQIVYTCDDHGEVILRRREAGIAMIASHAANSITVFGT